MTDVALLVPKAIARPLSTLLCATHSPPLPLSFLRHPTRLCPYCALARTRQLHELACPERFGLAPLVGHRVCVSIGSPRRACGGGQARAPPALLPAAGMCMADGAKLRPPPRTHQNVTHASPQPHKTPKKRSTSNKKDFAPAARAHGMHMELTPPPHIQYVPPKTMYLTPCGCDGQAGDDSRDI
jgi:hypothetical protein